MGEEKEYFLMQRRAGKNDYEERVFDTLQACSLTEEN
jgi:hypothetical protein